MWTQRKSPFHFQIQNSINQSECPDSVESTKGFVTKAKPVHWNVQCFKNCNPRSTSSLQIDPNSVDIEHSKISVKKIFHLVGKKFENKLFKTNPFSTSVSFNYVRCLRSSLLSSPRIRNNSGFLEKLSVFLAHKQKGVKSSLSGAKILNPKSNKCSCSNLHQQQNGSCLYKSFGGHKVSELNSTAVKMWAWFLERNMFLSALYVPGLMNKTADLLSRLKLESTEWMLSPRIFKQMVYVYRMPVLDMFASTLNHQVPKYFSWTLDPQAVGMDTFSVNWDKGLLYMFPPFSLIQKCLQKIIKDKATVLLITPVWQSRSWYSMPLNLLYDRPLLLPHTPQILKLPWSQTVHPLFQNRSFVQPSGLCQEIF